MNNALESTTLYQGFMVKRPVAIVVFNGRNYRQNLKRKVTLPKNNEQLNNTQRNKGIIYKLRTTILGKTMTRLHLPCRTHRVKLQQPPLPVRTYIRNGDV